MSKLGIKLRDEALAARLHAAGFRNPTAIRRATDKELEAVSGVGKSAVKAIRARLPRRR